MKSFTKAPKFILNPVSVWGAFMAAMLASGSHFSIFADPPHEEIVPLPVVSVVEQNGPSFGESTSPLPVKMAVEQSGPPFSERTVLLPTQTVIEEPPIEPATAAQLQKVVASRTVLGFVSRWDAQSGWRGGTLRININRLGGFTGVIRFGTERVPFSGRFATSGAFQTNVQTTAGSLRIRFQIVKDSARLWIAGSFARSGSTFGPLEFEGVSFGVNSR